MTEKTKNNRNRLVIASLVGIVIVAVGAWLFFETSGEPSQSAADAAATLAPDEAASETGELVAYQLEPSGTTARFAIDEVLNGNDVTAVGTTNEVAADLRVNLQNPAQSQLGEIVINARTIETDNTFRNRALRLSILQSSQDQYEFIRFQPTSLEGLPTEPVSVGDTLEFQIVGDLTILDTTQQETFDAQVTLEEDDLITGTASTTILYPDYSISIPEVQSVASVEDEVRLELEFVATAGSADAEATAETTESDS